jgi:putative ABC transport system permease protein
MSWISEIFRRRSLFHRRLFEDLHEELRQHIEEKTEQLMRDQDLSRSEAEQAAHRAFGNTTRIEERSREPWQWPRIESLWADLRYAARQLRKSPGFAITAVLTLAVGIGANTAVFSVMNAVLLRPLSFPHPERIFQMEEVAPEGENYDTSIPLFLEWRDHSRMFQSVAAYPALPAGFNLAEKGHPERVPGLRVSADFFRVLGVVPLMGRDFAKGEDREGSQRVVILSDSLWRRRYKSDAGIIGKTIAIDGQRSTVIGILPRGFQFLAAMPASGAVEVWSPLQLSDGSRDPTTTLQSIGRLKDGVTREQAAQEITALSRRKAHEIPALLPVDGIINLLPLQQRISGDTRPTLLLLFGAVSIILLIACANFANLLLARAGERTREISVRAALGATRLRVIRQLLTESVLLSVIGGAVGMLVATAMYRVLVAGAPSALLRAGDVSVDWRVLLFALAVSLLSGIVFGLLPALRLGGVAPADAIRESGSRSATRGRGYRRISNALVIAETAMSLMLLITAGLFIESFAKLREVNPGFDYTHALSFETTLPAAKYSNPADLDRFLRNASERMQAIPGIDSVAGASSLPTEATINMPFAIEGAATHDQVSGESDYVITSADYFRAMRISVLEGRALTLADNADAAGVVVINRAMAQKFWPNQDPIGKRIVIARNLGPDWVDHPRQIVGVVGDAKADSFEEAAPPIMYAPFAQLSPHFVSVLLNAIPIRWVARYRDPAASGLTQQIQAAVESADADEPIAEVHPLSSLVSDALLRWRFNMMLLGAFAAIALLLAAIGLYGVISCTVGQRTHEIGIRMALGAGRASVLNMVMRQAGVLIAAGALIGFAGLIFLSRVLKGFIYGVSPGNPGVLIAVSTLMFLVGVLAAWKPAHRAASIDPTQALRSE